MNFRSEKCIFQAGGGQAVHDLGEVPPRDDADGGRVPQGRRVAVLRGREAPRVPAPVYRYTVLQLFFNILQFLAGSFSAVSKRNFARKYAFDSIFQALQDLLPFAPLQSQDFRKKSVLKISNFRENSAKFLQMLQNL